MLIKKYQIKVPIIMILNLILVLGFIILTPVNGVESIRKLDENGTGEKCTPCGYTSSPPPPPPANPPPSPKKPSSSQYCPPPPSSSYIYITGPPGVDLYPVDENFNGASHGRHHQNFAAFLVPIFVALFSMIAFW